MTFRVIFDDIALKYIEKLPVQLRERIFNKIITTKENPFHYFERMVESSFYKPRIGDYRVLADIDQEKQIIQVRFVGHRKNIYKN
jgi:mRNA interferase RelE/StbE